MDAHTALARRVRGLHGNGSTRAHGEWTRSRTRSAMGEGPGNRTFERWPDASALVTAELLGFGVDAVGLHQTRGNVLAPDVLGQRQQRTLNESRVVSRVRAQEERHQTGDQQEIGEVTE